MLWNDAYVTESYHAWIGSLQVTTVKTYMFSHQARYCEVYCFIYLDTHTQGGDGKEKMFIFLQGAVY